MSQIEAAIANRDRVFRAKVCANDPPLGRVTKANAPGWRMDMLGFD
jgi:hypothetical protein